MVKQYEQHFRANFRVTMFRCKFRLLLSTNFHVAKDGRLLYFAIWIRITRLGLGTGCESACVIGWRYEFPPKIWVSGNETFRYQVAMLRIQTDGREIPKSFYVMLSSPGCALFLTHSLTKMQIQSKPEFNVFRLQLNSTSDWMRTSLSNNSFNFGRARDTVPIFKSAVISAIWARGVNLNKTERQCERDKLLL